MKSPDWKFWCRREKDLNIKGDIAIVTLHAGRIQHVAVTQRDETYELTSVVAKPATAESIPDIKLWAWRKNRYSQRVGFRFNDKGWLVAMSWTPIAGVTESEFLECLRHVAAEADLFEYQVTGQDRQ